MPRQRGGGGGRRSSEEEAEDTEVRGDGGAPAPSDGEGAAPSMLGGALMGHAGHGGHRRRLAVFSFLYFLKIKISKIYVRFEIFQKYPPVAPP